MQYDVISVKRDIMMMMCQYEITVMLTGKYRGSAHSQCNLKWQISADKFKLVVSIS